eukprot:s128_g9.t2
MKHQSDASKADGAKSLEADSTGCGDSSKGPKSPRMESREDGSVHSLTRRADFLASRARHAEALPLVDEALRIEPGRPDLHLGRGQCLEHMEKLDEALLCYEAALRLDAQSMAAQRNKALLLARQQRWREAAGSFREVLRLELALPVQKEMRLELARCLTEDAIQLKAAGQPNLHGFHEAIQACETYAPAYFQLGVHYSEANNSAKAKEMYTKAVQLQPGYVEALNNLGVACRELGEWDHAVEAYALALKVNQNCSKTRENMAIALLQLGCRHLQGKELKQASKALKQGLSFNSRNADLYFNLGVLYAEKEKWDQAKVNYELAIHFDPRHANAHNNLGVIHSLLTGNPSDAWATSFTEAAKEWEAQRVERLSMIPSKSEARHLPETGEAIRCSLPRSCMHASSHDLASRLAVHRPRTFDSWMSYETDLKTERGCTMDACEVQVYERVRLGNVEAAMKCFESALEVDSKMNLANKNLGAIYGSMGRMADAIRLTRVAIESSRQDAEAYNNLALLLRDQCDVDACLENLDLCISLEPENRHAGSNRLMSLNYQSERLPEEVFEAHRSWGRSLEQRLGQAFYRWNHAQKGAAAPLRVGYVSPDFYSHSVSYFIHAALKYHDPAFVDVVCYSDVVQEDDKTRHFRSLVPRWRNICGRRDEEVAKLIWEDGIDILVDLTGHTGNNRLGVFACKPAPVCITWLGYPHTTGLSRMDYRISDEHADPKDAPGLTTEKLLYLPECFLCYTPPDSAPPVLLKPAQENYGCVTFGCFNNLAKVSTLTIRLWSKVLHEVPDARLFVKSKALACPKVQEKMRRAFAMHGIAAARLDLTGLQPQTGSHLHMYSFIDVALDTAPYAGTTTTCEALYMGVPVVTLKGRGIHAQNVGASLLSAVQLSDLVTETEEEFVKQAGACARNVARLAALRAGLRTRMQRSVLCDGPRHVARLERLYATVMTGMPEAGLDGWRKRLPSRVSRQRCNEVGQLADKPAPSWRARCKTGMENPRKGCGMRDASAWIVDDVRAGPLWFERVLRVS